MPFFVYFQVAEPAAIYNLPFSLAMNLLSRIHDKARPIAAFLLVMVVVLGSSLVERRLMSRVSTSVASLYQDRLLPATGLFALNDLLYAKQQLLEMYSVASAANRPRTRSQLAGHNQQIGAIIKLHQATYLVTEEKKVLRTFEARLGRCNALEAQLLASDTGPTAAQLSAINQQFQRLHVDLSQLNQIQQQVGQQLSQSSRTTEGTAELLSTFTIALLLVFTLAIQYSLLASRHPLVPKNMQNFRLN